MTYSYTQISHYLACPRRYRHKYLDGWQEKDLRAAMLFGRATAALQTSLPAKASKWSSVPRASGYSGCGGRRAGG